jgi:hypothetical protein
MSTRSASPLSADLPEPEEALFYQGIIRSLVAENPRHTRRPWLTRQVDRALEDPNCQFILITGDSGAGKSEFLAELAYERPDCLRYFLRDDSRASLSHGDARTFLLTIGHQFAALHPRAFPEALDLSVEQHVRTVKHAAKAVGVKIEYLTTSPFRRTAIRARQDVGLLEGDLVGIEIGTAVEDPQLLTVPVLQKLALEQPATTLGLVRPDEPVVVLVDAVDEIRYGPDLRSATTILDWLAGAPGLPSNIKFVIASRSDNQFLGPLRRGRSSRLKEIALTDFSASCSDDVRQYVANALEEPGPRDRVVAEGIDIGLLAQRIVARSAGNFQYATTMIRALDAPPTGQPVQLGGLLAGGGLPESLGQLYASFVSLISRAVDGATVEVTDAEGARHRAPVWPTLYRPLLGVLTVAKEPLDRERLRLFSGADVDDHAIDEALRVLSQFLQHEHGRYRLFHRSFGEFLLDESTARLDDLDCHVDAARWHGRITSVLARQLDGARPALEPYARRHLAAHAAAVGQLAELMELPLFLVLAEPDGLIRELGPDLLDPGTPASVYAAVYDLIRTAEPAERAAYLELAARELEQDELAARIAGLFLSGSWSLRWTRRSVSPAYRRVLSPGSELERMTTTWVSGRPVVVGVSGEPPELRAYDLLTGSYVRGLGSLPGGHVTALGATTASGQTMIAVGTAEGDVYVADLDELAVVGGPWSKHEGQVTSVDIEYVGDTGYVVSVDDSARAQLCDAATGAAVASPVVAAIQPEFGSRFSLMSPTEEIGGIVVTGEDKPGTRLTEGVKVSFSDRRGRLIEPVKRYRGQASLVSAPNGLVLFWGTSSNRLEADEVFSGESMLSISFEVGTVADLAVAKRATGDYVVAISNGRAIAAVFLPPVLRGLEGGPEELIGGRPEDQISSVSVVEVEDRAYVVWSTARGDVYCHDVRVSLPDVVSRAADDAVDGIRFARLNGRQMILGGQGHSTIDGASVHLKRGSEPGPGSLLLFDAFTGTPLGSLLTLVGGHGISAFAFGTRRGRRVLIAGTLMGSPPIVYDLGDDTSVTLPDDSIEMVSSLDFVVLDERPLLFVGGHSGYLLVFDLDSLELVRRVDLPEPNMVVTFSCVVVDQALCVAFVTWGSKRVTFVEVASGHVRFSKAETPTGSLSAFDLSGNLIVTGDTRGFVRLYDLRNDVELTRVCVGSPVNDVAFVPDGVAVSTGEGLVVLNLHW